MIKNLIPNLLFITLGLTLFFVFMGCETRKSIFSTDNLVAWCIVPFDAKERGPVERAQMLKELGITRLAYDWREEHIPTFDEEWKALNEHNIKLQAFWMVAGQDPANDNNVQAVFDFLERNKVSTELWLLIWEWPGFDSLSQDEKVRMMAAPIEYIADRAAALDCTVGLYNHRKWFGEPENQLAILKYLDRPNIGIVYNFHHAVEHHERFPEFFPRIKPHLMAVNVAGIRAADRKNFYGVGEGDTETEMLRMVLESEYDGPIGIINHDENRDAREGLVKEMTNLQRLASELK
ncbi:MAG TPA: TIM barrel protein [Cyclobacteriaceae bacterium]|nr:TIM barrel protein [Cyclobacteriaceae bacterium]